MAGAAVADAAGSHASGLIGVVDRVSQVVAPQLIRVELGPPDESETDLVSARRECLSSLCADCRVERVEEQGMQNSVGGGTPASPANRRARSMRALISAGSQTTSSILSATANVPHLHCSVVSSLGLEQCRRERSQPSFSPSDATPGGT